MKKIWLVRHGFTEKTNPNWAQLIPQEELDRISENFINAAPAIGDLDYVFHSTMIRTSQCLIAAMIGMMGYAQHAQLLYPVTNITPTWTFDDMYPEGFTNIYASGVDAVQAFIRYWGSQTCDNRPSLDYWMDVCAKEVTEIFNLMRDGTVALGFNHTPAIEIAALRLDPENATDDGLKELEGIVFTAMDDGSYRTDRVDMNVSA